MACFYMTISESLKYFQYFNFETNFLENDNISQKTGYRFLVETTKIENKSFPFKIALSEATNVNPIQDGLCRGCSRMGGGCKKASLPKICHTYPTMIKLGTVIPYLKKIQKIYESRDTPLEFC